MTQATEAGPRSTTGNIHDHDYDALRARVQERFTGNVRDGKASLFKTDATGLWGAYLESFPVESRQYHNCSACRHFIERYGSLVTIAEDGSTTPAVWHLDDANDEHSSGFEAMLRIVSRAKVTGVFLSSQPELGQGVTGEWTHFSVVLSEARGQHGL